MSHAFRPDVILLACTTACLSVCGCGSDPGDSGGGPSSLSATLSLNWYPDAQHGGYYEGLQNGISTGGQLTSVEIVPGGPGAPQLIIQELAAGRTQFAVSSADQLVLARAQGVPLIAVLAPIRQSPRCIMVAEDSGITRLSELSNMQLAVSETRPFALWMKKQLPLTDVVFVPYSGQVGEFLTGDRFGQQAYSFSEPFVAAERGRPGRALMLSEIGFNPYASLLITTEDTVRTSPELVQSMVSASVRGWTDYLRDPSDSNRRLTELNDELTEEALEFAVQDLRNLCAVADGTAFGMMSAERWSELIRICEEVGAVEPGSVNPAECFTNRFFADAD